MPYKLPSEIHNLGQINQIVAECQRYASLHNNRNQSISSRLESFMITNNIKTLDGTSCNKIVTYLRSIIEHPAEITLTLATPPSPEEKNELITDLRRMFHVNLLVHIVVQPDLLAGCTVRTRTNYFDMSLKHSLWKNKQKLMKELSYVRK